ncbi:MAG: RNA-directed DNA polymerase [Verrucomicrobiales bacterium]|nr:RNA-directed DNA polymerase [Verrucomicrobiales bacterium]
MVHHALCQIIEPDFERSFVDDSFANRIGKGTHRALDHLQQLTRRFRFVLQCDLRQFFPSIDHAVLMETLSRKIEDHRILQLCQGILDSGRGVLKDEYDMVWFAGDDLFAPLRPRGLPIGNLTSQFWANCHLNPFDHFVKRELRCRGYVRYVDDFALFSDDKDTLWEWKSALVERLSQLRLTLHAGAHPRPVSEGLPFLGFITFPGRRRLKRRKGVHFERKLRRTASSVEAGMTPLTKLNESIRSWVEHVRHGNTTGLRKAVLGRIRLKLPRPIRKQHSTGSNLSKQGATAPCTPSVDPPQRPLPGTENRNSE